MKDTVRLSLNVNKKMFIFGKKFSFDSSSSLQAQTIVFNDYK